MTPLKIILPPGRGTPLFVASEDTNLTMSSGDRAPRLAGIIGGQYHERMPDATIRIPAREPFMVINLDPDRAVEVTSSRDFGTDEILYDPYLHEDESETPVDPEEFRAAHQDQIPDGFVDILAKWYSVKFTYADHNRIFVLPGWGISFQVHAERTEHWTIRGGEPIIVAGDRVAYDVPAGTRFDIPVGATHTVINPHGDRVVFLEERYSGHFDEEDITRVFNPNAYGVK